MSQWVSESESQCVPGQKTATILEFLPFFYHFWLGAWGVVMYQQVCGDSHITCVSNWPKCACKMSISWNITKQEHVSPDDDCKQCLHDIHDWHVSSPNYKHPLLLVCTHSKQLPNTPTYLIHPSYWFVMCKHNSLVAPIWFQFCSHPFFTFILQSIFYLTFILNTIQSICYHLHASI